MTSIDDEASPQAGKVSAFEREPSGSALSLVSAVLGVCIVWINVGAITLVQRRTPARLLGRVDAAANVLITVPQATSIAVGAAAIAVLDYRILLAVMAAVMLAAAGYLAGVPGLRAGTATRDLVTASNRVQR